MRFQNTHIYSCACIVVSSCGVVFAQDNHIGELSQKGGSASESHIIQDQLDHWDHSRPFLEVGQDESILIGDVRFESFAEFASSTFFRNAGLRCGIPNEGIGLDGDPSDCSFDRTNPIDAYDPSVGEYCIPVVFHVLRANDGVLGHVSKQQIHNQIDVLNESFRAIAGFPGEESVDCKISFKLATIDPAGNPVDGITYTDNTMWYNDEGAYFDTLAWDPAQYLNIYSNSAGGTLGYVPWLPQDGNARVGDFEDRLVLNWMVVGKNAPQGGAFNLGRTATHEVGHYLGLFHTFQDGCSQPCVSSGDRICDTDPESQPHYGCRPRSTCGTSDPIANYMDFSDDLCSTEFTPHQARRMRCTLESYRPSLFRISETKLVPDHSFDNDRFGSAISIDGDQGLFGAYLSKENGEESGAAFIRNIRPTAEMNEVKLLPSDGKPGDWFGSSVLLSADLAAVGAATGDGREVDSGCVYLFTRDGSQWIERTKLMASDGERDDLFGSSLAFSGNRIVVGAPFDDETGFGTGAAYVYRYDGSRWIEEARLVAPDGHSFSFFGTSVAIDEHRIIVGASHDGANGRFSGAAYAFAFDGVKWNLAQKFRAAEGNEEDLFGHAVNIDGDRLLVSAIQVEYNGDYSGAVYFFSFDGIEWIERSTLLASDGATNDVFGWSVALSETTALIGAHRHDHLGESSGAAYLFEFDGSQWNETRKLLAFDGEADDQFGVAVGIADDVVVVGADGDWHLNDHSGSVYVMDLWCDTEEPLNLAIHNLALRAMSIQAIPIRVQHSSFNSHL